MEECRSGGVEWSGGVEERRSGGVEEWRSGEHKSRHGPVSQTEVNEQDFKAIE